jgi:hypothetical protein
MAAKTLPKTFVHKGVRFNLLDVQYSKSNADFAAQIFAHRLPNAKYVIRHDTLNGKDFYGVYTTMKVSNTVEKKGK